MENFPAVDPIPLPAPVWIFKALHFLTTALHFPAVHFMVGGLFWVVVWQFMGKFRNQPTCLDASGAVAFRLPVVLAYVINLGVPPLLFAQVLYGRGLYTSSVLIGAWWLAVIGLLLVYYGLLYWMSIRAEKRRGMLLISLVALGIALKIAYIYSSNMTLMLRPEVWREMYRTSPTGTILPTGDPTLAARWLYMMSGAVWLSGVFLLLLAMKSNLAEETSQLLRKFGGLSLAVLGLVQIGLGYNVFRLQPDAVRAGLTQNSLYLGSAGLWLLTVVLLMVLGLLAWKNVTARCWKITGGACLAAFLNEAAITVFRDGIRDVSLSLHGYNVWDRAVNANWLIVGLFLLSFVLGLVAMAWLISVVLRAKTTEERYV